MLYQICLNISLTTESASAVPMPVSPLGRLLSQAPSPPSPVMISAEEIENLILSHPAVLNVACVPMPDPVLGERTCAFVIPQPGATLTLSELNVFLLDKGIAKFKLPERLELVEDFPLSKFGKVSKHVLAQQIADKLAAER